MKNRRSIRLKEYDYSQSGAYFVTICTRDRDCLFGEIVDKEMILNDTGRMVHRIWEELPRYYPGVDIDVFTIMPNHFHGIILLTGIVGAGPRACPNRTEDSRQPQGVAPTLSLPDVVHRFKSLTTAQYRYIMKENGQQSITQRLWQRNYYEHVIRNESDLNQIRQYIIDNPAKWDLDEENPDGKAA